jgi:Uma2 family endonuclease
MPGLAHEIFKKIIGYLIETFFFERQIRVIPTGSVSQEQIGEASAQADESYCIGNAKPIPDLSIEVTFTSGGASKLQRYQALDVPEVWFWQDGVFSLYRLHSHGYEPIQRSEISELADLDIALLSRSVLIGETDWLEAVRTFKEGIQPS